MADSAACLPKDAAFREPLWDTETTAKFICKSPKSLEADRLKNVGLPYIRLGRAVRYDPAVIRAYIAKKTVTPSETEGDFA